MKHRKLVITSLAVVVLAVATAIYLYAANASDKNNEVQQSSITTQTIEQMAAKNSSDTEAEATAIADKSTDLPYITLDEYNANPSSYTDRKKVYFFHAAWCSICQGIHNDISSDPSKIPSGTTFIKTDFDSNTTLRQKYGVTTQYTFVQVDNDGNELKQWSATNLDKAIAGIQ